MSGRYLFTSESVTEGHPDKVADQISDAILDDLLAKDPMARVAAETVVATGLTLVAGEISTTAYVDIPRVVRDTIRQIGYTRAKMGFDSDTVAVLTSIDEQSGDIAQGVDRSWEEREGADGDELSLQGAGDQGLVFGYACRETPELMPLPIALAHRLARRLADVRKDGTLPFLWPDGKTQVTVAYENHRPVAVDTVVVSAQHQPETSQRDLADALCAAVVRPVLGDLATRDLKVLVNPTGRFVVGGPRGDTGLTGRKIIVDTYGGMARHGGGAFSGKDPTKVDRSASYAARWVAKHLVAARLAERAEVQVSYAIGVARPLAVSVDTFGTGVLPDDRLAAAVQDVFDLRPLAIIRALDLRRPLYRQTAAYGHFGRPDLNLPWERLDRLDALAAATRARA
ncbi:MAG: methionine adenosyltransferase [Thermaerobacter sp.]|nr:methionine adenosyltransferase [Thermaerobacter sp.]